MSSKEKINGFTRKNKFSWNGVFILKKDKKPSQPGGIKKASESLRVEINPITGDYTVSENAILGGEEIYKFDGNKNKVRIINDGLYKKFFKSKELKNNFDTVHDKTRKSVLKISRETEISQGTNPNNPNSRTFYLANLKAYKSFAKQFIEINNGEKTDKPVKKNTKGGNKGGSGGGKKNNGNGLFSNDYQLTFKTKTKIPEPTKNPGIYRYPNYYLGDLGYDYIMFEPHEYVPSVKAKVEGAYGASTGEVIVLPMVPGLQSTNSTDWGDDSANLIQQMMGVMANNFILSSSDPQGELVSNIGKALSGFMGDLGTGIDTILKDDNLRPAAAAYFAGQAANVNILGRTTGTVINPNLELLFKGPRLRTFNFTFPMTPRTKEESETIRQICRIFKQRMAPRRSNTGLFLQTPYIFKLRYVFNDNTNKNHEFLNKFKPCALTNFSVNYTPDGNYSTLHNGSMTKYTISMSFGEIETIYADDYDSGNQKDMGF